MRERVNNTREGKTKLKALARENNKQNDLTSLVLVIVWRPEIHERPWKKSGKRYVAIKSENQKYCSDKNLGNFPLHFWNGSGAKSYVYEDRFRLKRESTHDV